ncbi:MAG: hypothetical protein HQM13_23280 [SAR324 cluster bacterium]|nr:hypothetical protein [SAR324 cluster bacterium]
MKNSKNLKSFLIQFVFLLSLIVAYAGSTNAKTIDTSDVDDSTQIETSADTENSSNDCGLSSCRSGDDDGDDSDDGEDSDDDGEDEDDDGEDEDGDEDKDDNDD